MTLVPELLIPAGSLEKLKYALAFGADAVYVGIPLFSLRARENEFSVEQLHEARSITKNLGKKLYVTANIFARNRKVNAFEKHIHAVSQVNPDALIMSDPGLIMMVREAYPEIPIHLSVQSNCMNWKSVKFWYQEVGVERVILSRELNLSEIQEIKQRVPEVELEAFVHGSICIAYSGRCLLSSYFVHRDANQGVCDNSCRENFQLYRKNLSEENLVLEDLRNKGEFYPIEEDENGTYIMNAKDLNLIQHLKKIADAGVCSFKVEGRTKSEYYVAMVARAYRSAIDQMQQGREFDHGLLAELEKVANRGYHTGFMIHEPNSTSQNYDNGNSRRFTQKFAGLVRPEINAPLGYIPTEIRNRLSVGQEIEVVSPGKLGQYGMIEDLIDSDGHSVSSLHGGTGVGFIKISPSNIKVDNFSILSVKT